MIVIGLGVVTLGFSQAGDTVAVANIWAHDGIFPKGIGSSLMTLQGVMFASSPSSSSVSRRASRRT